MSDRHENKNWEFRSSKEDPKNGGKIRLYRNRKDRNLFKRVSNHCGTNTCDQWEIVMYAVRGKEINGEPVWVSKQADLVNIDWHIKAAAHYAAGGTYATLYAE